jgi:tetrahydromethanopterin S-methyltransferase subunit G
MNEEATQNLIASRLDQIVSVVNQTNARMGVVEQSLRIVEQIDIRVQGLGSKVEALDGRVQAMDDKVEHRLHDTRPIWEGVQTRLDEINERFKVVETDITRLRAEVTSGFRAVDRKIGVLSKNMIDMTADIRELQDRIEKLETPPS